VASITVYAQWTANTYTVTFDGNGGGTPSPTSKSVTYASTYGTLAAVARTGYTLNGWFTATSGGTQVTSATTVTILAAQTLYAQWTAIPLTGYSVTGASAGKLSTSYTFTANCSGGSGSYTYVWNGGGSTSNTKNYSWSSTGAQAVSVTITDAINGLSVTPSTTCTIYSAPTANINGYTAGYLVYANAGTQYLYYANVTGGMPNYTYAWTTGGNASPSSGSSWPFAVTWSNPTPGYANSSWLNVVVTDALGQTFSTYVNIYINP
jgi:uncharacterized repeat protein (TIGR02543 family)